MSIQACADLVRKGDPFRFRAAMAAKPNARAILFPLLAFNLEVARAPWVTKEPMIAEMRLQWWRDALNEIKTGQKVRAHEVTTPLADVLAPKSAELLDQLVQARRWDIYSDPFESADHFKEYIDATSGNLLWSAADLLGSQTEQDVRMIANASGLANLFLALPALVSAGRKPLFSHTSNAVIDLATDALKRLKAAKPDKAASPVVLQTISASHILTQAEKDPDAVLNGALKISEFRTRLRLLQSALLF